MSVLTRARIENSLRAILALTARIESVLERMHEQEMTELTGKTNSPSLRLGIDKLESGVQGMERVLRKMSLQESNSD